MSKKKGSKSVGNTLRRLLTLLKQFLYFLYGNFGLMYGKLQLHQGKDKEAVIRWVRTEKKVINKERFKKQLASYISDNEDWKKSLYYIDIGLHGKSNINNPRIKAFQKWLEYNKIANIKPKVKTFKDIALMYREQKAYQASDIVLKHGIKLWKNNKTLHNEYAINAIHLKKWVVAIERFTFNKTLYKNQKTPMTLLVRLSMLYQIIGFTDKTTFENINNNYSREIEEDSKGYRKITLFDNGDSRIDFYKKLKPVSKVVITFDSINMIWSNPPFGYKLLKKQDVDIIAVRKRKKQTYMQDLSQEDFVYAVRSLLDSYEDKIAYGYSLGAYAALYYASNVYCRILAISPRLSIHPKYGKRNLKKEYTFLHNTTNNFNEKISPIIVYDPKNKLDHRYVQKELLKSFPNSKLVEVKYGGHGMAPHLLQMNLLKEFILTVIDGEETPLYDKSKRLKSYLYYRSLARECFSRNKNKWALDIVEKCLVLSPTDIMGIELKFKILIKVNNEELAVGFLKKSIKNSPKEIELYLLLIDFYISKRNLTAAEKEINIADKELKNQSDSLKERKRIVIKLKQTSSP